MKHKLKEGLIVVDEAEPQGMFEGLWWMKQRLK